MSGKEDPRINGLSETLNPGGKEIRAAHPEWSRPNKKHAKRIEARQADYAKTLAETKKSHVNDRSFHKPGSHKK